MRGGGPDTASIPKWEHSCFPIPAPASAARPCWSWESQSTRRVMLGPQHRWQEQPQVCALPPRAAVKRGCSVRVQAAPTPLTWAGAAFCCPLCCQQSTDPSGGGTRPRGQQCRKGERGDKQIKRQRDTQHSQTAHWHPAGQATSTKERHPRILCCQFGGTQWGPGTAQTPTGSKSEAVPAREPRCQFPRLNSSETTITGIE